MRINPISILIAYFIVAIVVVLVLMKYYYNELGGGADVEVLVEAVPVILYGSLVVNGFSMFYFKQWTSRHKIIASILIAIGCLPFFVKLWVAM